MFHVAADLFTLFLWEFVGMPIELVFDGNKTSVAATYNKDKKVQEFNIKEGNIAN